MKQLRNFVFGMLAMAALGFLLRGFICQWFCPPCTPPAVPNPVVEFSVANADFGVTPAQISGASQVQLQVTDKNGAAVVSANLVPGTLYPVVAQSTAQRPLQLAFAYLNAAGDVIARDSLLIDDRDTGGTPPVEILIGAFQGNPQSCPNFTNNISVTQDGSPVKYKFTWAPGKQYKITHNNKSWLLLTVLGADGCYDAQLWHQNKFGCLDQLTMTSLSSTEGEVALGTGSTVKITGNDNCDPSNPTPREIFLRLSSPGTPVVVSD